MLPKMLIGRRVRLKINRTGTKPAHLGYTVHEAKAGEEGKVVPGIFSVLMDNGIEIDCVGDSFGLEDPDEQFKRTFEVLP